MSHVDLTIARTISCGLNSCLALDFTVTVIISCGFYSHFHHLVDFTVAIIISCGFKKSLSLPFPFIQFFQIPFLFSFPSVLPNSFPFWTQFVWPLFTLCTYLYCCRRTLKRHSMFFGPVKRITILPLYLRDEDARTDYRTVMKPTKWRHKIYKIKTFPVGR